MNNPKTQQALREVLEDLEALSPEEFRKELNKFLPPEEDQVFDTVRMLRES